MELQPRAAFNKWVHKFGIITSAILFLAMIGFPVFSSLYFGKWPDFGLIWPGLLSMILILAPFWPAEMAGYMPVLGPGALYMSYVTGNVTALRMPVTVGTINSLNLEPNTDACHAMALVACGASILTTTVVAMIGIFAATPLMPLLSSPAVQPAFAYLVPAIFGGLIAQTIMKKSRHALLYLAPLAISLFFRYFTHLKGPYYMMIAIAVSATIFILDYRRGKKAAPAEEHCEA